MDNQTEQTPEQAGRVALVHLRAWRDHHLLSQRALAEKSGVSPATINNIEQGHTSANYATIGKLAKALGVAPRALLKAPPEDDAA